MTLEARGETGGSPPAGRTTLTGRALQRLALGLLRDAAGIPARDISVSLSDDAGALQAGVTIPITLGTGDEASLIEQGTVLREALVHGMDAFAGRRVSSVDIRFSGARAARKRRVT